MIILVAVISFCLGYMLCKILSTREIDGFCFLHKEGSKDQLIFNLFKEPETILQQKVVKFKVVKLEEDDSYVSESQLRQRVGSVLSDPTNLE